MALRSSLLPSSFYLLTLLSLSCRAENPQSQPKGSEAPSSADSPWFVERAAETGLAFTHVNGMRGKFDYGRYRTLAVQWEIFGGVALLTPVGGLVLMVLKPS